MTSYNAFSYIPVMKTDFILKTSIDKKLCQDIIEVTNVQKFIHKGSVLQNLNESWCLIKSRYYHIVLLTTPELYWLFEGSILLKKF